VPQVPKVVLELLALLDRPDHKVALELLALLDHKDRRGLLELPAPPVHEGLPESLVLLDLRVRLE
jgi:hypothetical protein